MKKLVFLLCSVAILGACAVKESDSPDYDRPAFDGMSDEDVPGGAGGSNENGSQGTSGVVTAGEWRDLDNWLFWSNLMTNKQVDQEGSDYTIYSDYWKLFTNNRVAVRVTDESGVPQRDMQVVLNQHQGISDEAPTTLYVGRTDYRGEVNLWIGLAQQQAKVNVEDLGLLVNGGAEIRNVAVTNWGDEVKWNEVTASSAAPTNIDIAFIVDATGSMMDEIDFLKADLRNIISEVATRNATMSIRTAAVFYRDKDGDEYLTRESDFSSDMSVTASFIAQQSADGGGDYPEAVHTALEVGLQKLSWKEDNSIRLAFMLLDAPPHHEDNVIESLHKSIPQYAQKGIRIIPVAASGVDKPTEFFLRFTAIATDGTYVFITNDSGVGNEHIAATVGQYEVEKLNELIIRLINQYMSY